MPDATILDWSAYLRGLAREIAVQDARMVQACAAAEREIGRFRNIDYPLSSTPLVLDPRWEAGHRQQVEQYLALLEKTVAACRQDSGISDYLGHSELDRAFVRSPCYTERFIEVCRLDGYVDRSTGQLKILEHNSDSPAGILFTPRLNAIVRRIDREFGGDLDAALAPAQFDDPSAVQDFFGSFAPPSGGGMVVLQETGKSNVESREMACAFAAGGLPTLVCAPDEVEVAEAGVRAQGRPASVIWNKINSVYWQSYVGQRPEMAAAWLRLVGDGRVRHLNHFGARLVTENKRCLALLREPEFASLFSDAERDLAARMLPWAVKCVPGKQVTWQGENHDLKALALKARERLVLKEPYDIRGDGVTVGRGCPEEEWRDKVAAAFEFGNVLQEYVPPLRLPIAGGKRWMPAAEANVSLDTFAFGGRVVGYGAKASTGDKVNVFKGGRKLAVLVGNPVSAD